MCVGALSFSEVVIQRRLSYFVNKNCKGHSQYNANVINNFKSYIRSRKYLKKTITACPKVGAGFFSFYSPPPPTKN